MKESLERDGTDEAREAWFVEEARRALRRTMSESRRAAVRSRRPVRSQLARSGAVLEEEGTDRARWPGRGLQSRLSRRLLLERREKRAAAAGEPGFEAGGAVAVAARPRLGAVFVAASASRVRVLDLFEIEILVPVFALFLQRRRAEAHLDPLHTAVVVLARVGHVAQVLAAGDRSATERAIVDRLAQRGRLTVSDAGRDQIAHRIIVADFAAVTGSRHFLPVDSIKRSASGGPHVAGRVGRDRRVGLFRPALENRRQPPPRGFDRVPRMNSVGSPAMTSSSRRS